MPSKTIKITADEHGCVNLPTYSDRNIVYNIRLDGIDQVIIPYDVAVIRARNVRLCNNHDEIIVKHSTTANFIKGDVNSGHSITSSGTIFANTATSGHSMNIRSGWGKGSGGHSTNGTMKDIANAPAKPTKPKNPSIPDISVKDSMPDMSFGNGNIITNSFGGISVMGSMSNVCISNGVVTVNGRRVDQNSSGKKKKTVNVKISPNEDNDYDTIKIILDDYDDSEMIVGFDIDGDCQFKSTGTLIAGAIIGDLDSGHSINADTIVGDLVMSGHSLNANKLIANKCKAGHSFDVSSL